MRGRKHKESHACIPPNSACLFPYGLTVYPYCVCSLLLRCIWPFVTPWTLCSPPGFFVHGISQARILKCVATSFSRGSSQSRDWTCISCTAGRYFTTEPSEKPVYPYYITVISLSLYCYYILSSTSPSSGNGLGDSWHTILKSPLMSFHNHDAQWKCKWC